MSELKKAIKLFKQSNKAYILKEQAEENYFKLDEKLHQQLKKLKNKEFEAYIKIIDKDINQ